MSIKLGIVMDPISSINIKKDTSFAMLEGLIERFFKSGELFELALETQKDYRKQIQL